MLKQTRENGRPDRVAHRHEGERWGTGPLQSRARSTALSDDACRSVLERTCFGTVAYHHHGGIDATPVRLVFVEGWLYFAADGALRRALANHAWVAVTVSDVLDAEHVASVVVRGPCYDTEPTGSPRRDAAALRGIVRLRDREPAGAAQLRRIARRHAVLRLHVEDVRGVTTRLPCGRAAALDTLNTREGSSPR